MPIEIRELVVKANVNENSANAATKQATQSGNSAGSEDDKKQLIEECVKEVMARLKHLKER